ncbi:MAG: hypothetical protein ACE5GW_03875, partial [Planctomycetota bacterium]
VLGIAVSKAVVHFDRKRLWDATDYRTRVFDPRTGHQPVRQVFFLHRDTTAAPLESLPGYLDGSLGDRSSSVLGAVAFLPERLEAVRRLIERFLAL